MKAETVTINGIVKAITEQEQISDKFSKKILAVETNEQYPQQIGIEFVNDKIALLNKVKEGDNVTVAVNIRGREYKGKYYTSLHGWRIEMNEGAVAKFKKDEEPDMPF